MGDTDDLQMRLILLDKAVNESRLRAQDTSAQKYELLWDAGELLQRASKDELRSLHEKFFSVVLDAVKQDPSPPLTRSLAECVVVFTEATNDLTKTIAIMREFINVMLSSDYGVGAKIAAMQCTGIVFSKLGTQLNSVSSDAVAALCKQFKSSTVAKRVTAVDALRGIFDGLKSSSSFLFGTTLKAIKNLASDREQEVRVAIARCLSVISGLLDGGETLDALRSILVKYLEKPYLAIRSTAAGAMGHALAVAHNNNISSPGDGGRLWDMLSTLTYLSELFLRPGATRENRAGVTQAMVSFFENLKTITIEKHMELCVMKVLGLVGTSPGKTYGTKAELLQACQCVAYVLHSGLRENLGEEGQKKMVKVLTDVLMSKSFNEYVLILALRQLGPLFLDLGQGAALLWGQVETPLSNLLSHTSSSVRIVTAITLRVLVGALQDKHANALRACLNNTTMEYAELSSCKQEEVKLHLGPLQGNAFGIAGLLAAAPDSRLGVPNTLTRFALKAAKKLATGIQKKNAAVMVARLESAWAIVSALVRHGASFWSGNPLATFIAIGTDTFSCGTSVKSERDVIIFSRVRSYALSALAHFGKECATLLETPLLQPQEAQSQGKASGGAKKGSHTVQSVIVAWLGDVLQSIVSIPNSSSFQPSTTDILCVLKRNLILAFASLPASAYQEYHGVLLKWSAAELTKGVTTSRFRKSLHEASDSVLGPWSQDEQRKEEQLVLSPPVVLQDASIVWGDEPLSQLTKAFPPAVKMVDALMSLFPVIFASKNSKIQKSVLDHFQNCAKMTSSQPLHRLSIQQNVLCALLTMLKDKKHPTPFPDSPFLKALQQFFQGFVKHEHPALRRAAGECLGLLCNAQGDKFTGSMVTSIATLLRQSPEGTAKAGCAFLLGSIFRAVGGMRAQAHLPAAVSALHVLAQDTAPTSHVWALHGLWLTIEACGLAFADFAGPTLALVHQLLLAPSHNSIGGYNCIGRIVNACIATLGPELDASGKTFRCCRAIHHHLMANTSPVVQLETIHFFQMLTLFAPQTVTAGTMVPFLRSFLTSTHISLRSAALQCLRQLVQRAPEQVSGNGLEEELIMMLDKEREKQLRTELEMLLTTLVEYLSPSEPALWLFLFKRVISATTRTTTAGAATKDGTETEPDDDDEDMTSSGALTGPAPDEEAESVFIPRWRTRVFCMECISRMLNVIEERPEHFDLAMARKRKEMYDESEDFLVFHLQALVSIAFNGATSVINALRPVGVNVLRQIVRRFSMTMDPDYQGHRLLEIYSAQVAAALRPAFDAEATPSLTAAACEVVVSFVTANITEEEGVLTKVLRLLTDCVPELQQKRFPAYSEQAATLVQLAILNALAELHVAAQSGSVQASLVALLEPVMGTLLSHWVALLRDYAILTTQPPAVQQAYKAHFFTSTTVENVIAYYDRSWLKPLMAAASLVNTEQWTAAREESKRAAHVAMEKEDAEAREEEGLDMLDNESSPTREDDFFILLGLCLSNAVTANEETTICCLNALSDLLTPAMLALPSFDYTNEMLSELVGMLVLQSQVGSANVARPSQKVLLNILAHIPPEYFSLEGKINAHALASGAFYPFVEAASIPVHRIVGERRGGSAAKQKVDESELEVATLGIESLGMLSRVWTPFLRSIYGPTVVHLLLRALESEYQTLHDTCVTSLASVIGCVRGTATSEEDAQWHDIARSALDFVARSFERSGSFGLLRAIPPLVHACGNALDLELQTRCRQYIASTVNHTSEAAQATALAATLAAITPAVSSDASSHAKSVGAFYFQTIGVEVMRRLAPNVVVAASPALSIEGAKVLLVGITMVDAPQRTALLSVVLPIFLALLHPAIPDDVSKFALELVQRLAASEAEAFRSCLNNVDQELKGLLEDALKAQQKMAAAAVARSRPKVAKKTARRQMKLTIDVDQYT